MASHDMVVRDLHVSLEVNRTTPEPVKATPHKLARPTWARSTSQIHNTQR
jgi:hypothetical protein